MLKITKKYDAPVQQHNWLHCFSKKNPAMKVQKVVVPILNFKMATIENHKSTEKPVLRGHSKLDKTKILMTYGSLLKAKSIAESIL